MGAYAESHWEPDGLTKISVQSTRDYYVVKHGSERAVRVYRRRYGLVCECGFEACKHIISLQLCGFIDLPTASSDSIPRAA